MPDIERVYPVRKPRRLDSLARVVYQTQCGKLIFNVKVHVRWRGLSEGASTLCLGRRVFVWLVHLEPSPVRCPKENELIRVYIVLVREVGRDVEDVAPHRRFGYPEVFGNPTICPALRHAFGHFVLCTGKGWLAHFG